MKLTADQEKLEALKKLFQNPKSFYSSNWKHASSPACNLPYGVALVELGVVAIATVQEVKRGCNTRLAQKLIDTAVRTGILTYGDTVVRRIIGRDPIPYKSSADKADVLYKLSAKIDHARLLKLLNDTVV